MDLREKRTKNSVTIVWYCLVQHLLSIGLLLHFARERPEWSGHLTSDGSWSGGRLSRVTSPKSRIGPWSRSLKLGLKKMPYQ